MEHTGLKVTHRWMILALVFLLDRTYNGAEGKCSLAHCTNRTTCVVMKDQRSCKCVTGYFDDRCDKDAEITVVCGENYIQVRALAEFFHYYKAKLENLHLPNRTCHVNETTIDGKKYYFSRTSKEDYSRCGGKPFEKNFTHIRYSLTLSSDPIVFNNIIRDPAISLDYSCTFPYHRKVSLAFPLIPYSKDIVMRVDDLDATIQMHLCHDENYTKIYDASQDIELGKQVYIKVEVTQPRDVFRMLVGECWATHSKQPSSTNDTRHVLIQNGCAKDDTLSFSNNNGEDSDVRFNFQMFRFTTGPLEFYLHCSVQLCDRNEQESCKPNCHSVAKREAVRADPAQSLLSLGPIKIREPKTSHSSVLATVVLPVAAVWTVGLFLVILMIVAKAGSRRLAQLDKPQWSDAGQLE